MAYFQRVWAQIDGQGNVVNRIIADDYETANVVTRDILGDDAFALEINNWRVNIGDKYLDNTFYHEDGVTPCEYIPDVENVVDELKYENETLKKVASYIAPTLTDEQALTVKSIFPTWESKVGKSVSTGERLYYMGDLYTVEEDINVVSEEEPPVSVVEKTTVVTVGDPEESGNESTVESDTITTTTTVQVANTVATMDEVSEEPDYELVYNPKYKKIVSSTTEA